MEGLDQVSEEFSFDKEKEIARSFSKRFQWEMMLIGVGQATIWLSLWPLVINGYISLGFVEWLIHLQEELMDATIYLEKLKFEYKKIKE